MAEDVKQPLDSDGNPIEFNNKEFKKVFTAPAGGVDWIISVDEQAMEFTTTDSDTAPVVDGINNFSRLTVRPGDGLQTLKVSGNRRIWARHKKATTSNSFSYAEVTS